MLEGTWTQVQLLAVGLALLGARVWGAGSGLNTVVVVNQQSSNSVELGNDYRERRAVPPQNVLRIDWTGGNVSWTTSQVQTALITPLRTMLAARGLTSQIDHVVLSMDIPYRVTAGADGNSTTSVLFYGFKTNNPADPGPCRIGPDSFSGYAGSEAGFRTTGSGTNAWTFLAAMLTGNTLAEAKETVERGVTADGTRPDRTVLLEKTSDSARNVRYFAFDHAIFDGQLLGAFPMVRTNSNVTLGFTNLLGMQTGLATFTLGTGVFVPGAVGDSLTSYGGRLFENTGQTTLLAFLQAGAAGSYGTVIEPCNYPEKFPDPLVYFYLGRGFNLAESYYQSLVSPYQGLIVGDPLAAPFAEPGTGTWVALPSGTVLNGIAPLSYLATALDTEHPLQRLDLFVDGTYHSTIREVAPAAGNVLTVTLGGHRIDSTVSSGATLASTTSALAAALNAESAATFVQATAHGDRIELRSTNLAVPGSALPVATAHGIGTAGALTTFIRSSRSDFLDTSARGWRTFEVSGAAAAGDYVGVTITKTGGSVVEVAVTNTSIPVSTVQLTRQLLTAINAKVSLQGADGVLAGDTYSQGTDLIAFLLYARSAGWPAAQIQISLWTSPGLTGGPSGPVPLDQNLSDLQPRNHLYLGAGASELTGSFDLDTTQLSDGYHDLTLVAYEGTHVRTQTRWTQNVRVQNTPLEATFTTSVPGSSSWIATTMQFTVTANAGNVASIELFSTGGLLASAAGQSSATFPVAGATLGLGLHPFYALVTGTDGSKYRTETRSIRIIPNRPPPTAAALLQFAAHRTAPRHVSLAWQTGFESQLAGFALERLTPEGHWTQLTPQRLAAHGGARPAQYHWEDDHAPASTASYRLLEIDWAGRRRVVGEVSAAASLSAAIQARPGALIVTASGQPGIGVLLESSTQPTDAPWVTVATLPLDAAGTADWRLSLPAESTARFYRLREP